MANDYYTVTGWPATGASGTSSPARAELALIAAGFDKLPDLTTVANRVPHVNSGSTALVTTSGYTFDGTWVDVPTAGGYKVNGVIVAQNAGVVSRSTNTILAAADKGKCFVATADFTQTLTAAATLGDGWWCDFRLDASGVEITFDPNGTENIDGATTLVIAGPCSGRIYCNGSAFFTVGFTRKQPTRQVFLSGTAATYTTPTGCRKIIVRAKAGGSGGGGSGTSGSGGGTAGGATIFNSIQADGGGPGGTGDGNGGFGGGPGSTGTASVRIPGAPGGSVMVVQWDSTTWRIYGAPGGGQGGGPGHASSPATVGNAAKANSGGGGGGGSGTRDTAPYNWWLGCGGGEGEYMEIVIDSPAATYTYTVGAGGTGGTAGTGGAAGGAGGSGFIYVDEFY